MVLPFNAGNRLVVTTTQGTIMPSDVLVQTRFVKLHCGMKEVANGKSEMWFDIETRPAFEVALLRKGLGGQLEILVCREQFLGHVKLPGGYYDDSENREAYRIAKILRDTGIKMANVVPAGPTLGHPEIKLPIDLFYTTQWESETIAPESMEIGIIPFTQAVALATTGRVANQSSFSLIMQVYYLLQEGKLKL